MRLLGLAHLQPHLLRSEEEYCPTSPGGRDAVPCSSAYSTIFFCVDPSLVPVYMAKDDISDSFYNAFVNINKVNHLDIIPSMLPDQDPLMLFFLTLFMGWVLSSPISCTVSEAVLSVANGLIKSNWKPPP